MLTIPTTVLIAKARGDEGKVLRSVHAAKIKVKVARRSAPTKQIVTIFLKLLLNTSLVSPLFISVSRLCSQVTATSSYEGTF